VAGKTKGNRDEIVGDRKGQDPAHGAVSPMSGLDEGGKEAESGMGEKEVGLAVEEGAIRCW